MNWWLIPPILNIVMAIVLVVLGLWMRTKLVRYMKAYGMLMRGCSKTMQQRDVLPMLQAMERSQLEIGAIKPSPNVPESNGTFETRHSLKEDA